MVNKGQRHPAFDESIKRKIEKNGFKNLGDYALNCCKSTKGLSLLTTANTLDKSLNLMALIMES